MCAARDEKSDYLYPLLSLDCCIFSPDIRLWEPTSETPAFLQALGSFLLCFLNDDTCGFIRTRLFSLI